MSNFLDLIQKQRSKKKKDKFKGTFLEYLEMIKDNSKLKLTEREINLMIFLSQSREPVKIEKLQKEVWEYNSELETHTVETHIYRLRKKIKDVFNDEHFILSLKNGYNIN